LIIFGVLIAVGTVFFPHGIITPDLFARRKAGDRRSASAVAGRRPDTER